MPTTEQQRPHPAESDRIKQVAESFGVDAERYDRARPRYPAALVDRIVAASPGRDVLDVGCGTGIASRQFQAAGCRVLGVDPDARMAEFARRRGTEVEVATFENWDPAGRVFDAVVAGQAWHWVHPIDGAVKAAAVLRSGGRLAVFAHVFDPPVEVAETTAAVYRRVAPDAPLPVPTRNVRDLAEAMATKFADGIRQANRFGEPEHWRFDWAHYYPRDAWLDLLPTTGALTQLPPDTLTEVLDRVGEAIDQIGGGFTMQYTTWAVTAVRV